jgi:hypothetical protein
MAIEIRAGRAYTMNIPLTRAEMDKLIKALIHAEGSVAVTGPLRDRLAGALANGFGHFALLEVEDPAKVWEAVADSMRKHRTTVQPLAEGGHSQGAVDAFNTWGPEVRRKEPTAEDVRVALDTAGKDTGTLDALATLRDQFAAHVVASQERLDALENRLEAFSDLYVTSACYQAHLRNESKRLERATGPLTERLTHLEWMLSREVSQLTEQHTALRRRVGRGFKRLGTLRQVVYGELARRKPKVSSRDIGPRLAVAFAEAVAGLLGGMAKRPTPKTAKDLRLEDYAAEYHRRCEAHQFAATTARDGNGRPVVARHREREAIDNHASEVFKELFNRDKVFKERCTMAELRTAIIRHEQSLD